MIMTVACGEAVMYFSMDADYELNESDLVITE